MKTIFLALILFFSSVANSATYNMVGINDSFLLNIDTNAIVWQVDLGILTESFYEASSPTENDITNIVIGDWLAANWGYDYIYIVDINVNHLFSLYSPSINIGGVYPYGNNLDFMVGYQFERGYGTGNIYTVTAYTPPPSGNVPEPGVLALLALGLLGLAINLNYRKKMI